MIENKQISARNLPRKMTGFADFILHIYSNLFYANKNYNNIDNKIAENYKTSAINGLHNAYAFLGMSASLHIKYSDFYNMFNNVRIFDFAHLQSIKENPDYKEYEFFQYFLMLQQEYKKLEIETNEKKTIEIKNKIIALVQLLGLKPGYKYNFFANFEVHPVLVQKFESLAEERGADKSFVGALKNVESAIKLPQIKALNAQIQELKDKIFKKNNEISDLQDFRPTSSEDAKENQEAIRFKESVIIDAEKKIKELENEIEFITLTPNERKRKKILDILKSQPKVKVFKKKCGQLGIDFYPEREK